MRQKVIIFRRQPTGSDPGTSGSSFVHIFPCFHFSHLSPEILAFFLRQRRNKFPSPASSASLPQPFLITLSTHSPLASLKLLTPTSIFSLTMPVSCLSSASSQEAKFCFVIVLRNIWYFRPNPLPEKERGRGPRGKGKIMP